MERITVYLERDHAQIDEALRQAIKNSILDSMHFLAFRARLLRHIAIEEKILFPSVPEIARDNRQLKVEHAALASLLVPHPDAALAVEIESILKTHNGAEEGPEGVYALYERALGRERSNALGERARTYAEVKVAPYSDSPRAHRTAAAALAAAQHLARGH